MNDDTHDSTGAPVPSAFHTIVFGGLAIGILDGIAATVNAAIRGVGPGRVRQYVASSVAGSDSSAGGGATVALGLLIHFCVAFGVAIAFYFLARLVPAVIRYAVIAGVIYGIAVYFAMSSVIVPMTLVRQGAFAWYALISGLIIHILFVGLPVALIAKRYKFDRTKS